MPLALPIAVILVAVTSQTRQHLLPSRIDLAVKKLLDDFRTLALPADDPQVIPQVATAT